MEDRICSTEQCGRSGKLTRGMCARCYRYWLDHTPKGKRGIAPRFVDDFWEQVQKTHDYGCWLWTGPTERKGYGRWRRTLAHRESWARANGSIPDSKWILHHCDNPPCVNPAHLYPGTVVENVRDMVTRGRAHTPPRKTHCNAGHLIDGDNLRQVTTSSGEVRRYCRACDNERSAKRQRDARHSRGLIKTKLSDEDRARICDLRRTGMPHRAIAKAIGRSMWSIQSTLKEAGL
jgi:hypothetical protein